MKTIIKKIATFFTKKEAIKIEDTVEKTTTEEPRKYGPLYQYRTNVKN